MYAFYRKSFYYQPFHYELNNNGELINLYSTVTLFAKFLGLSTSQPFSTDI